MKTVPTWTAYFTAGRLSPEQRRAIGVFFEYNGEPCYTFLGVEGVNPETRTARIDPKFVKELGVSSEGALRNWLFFWECEVKSSGLDKLTNSNSNNFFVEQTKTFKFDDSMSLDAITERLRDALLTPLAPKIDDEIAMLVEQGAALVPHYGDELEEVARWTLRGGEIPETKKKYKIKHKWLIPVFRGMYTNLGLYHEHQKPDVTEIASIMNIGLQLCTQMHFAHKTVYIQNALQNAIQLEHYKMQKVLDLEFTLLALRHLTSEQIETMLNDEQRNAYKDLEFYFDKFYFFMYRGLTLFHDKHLSRKTAELFFTLISPPRDGGSGAEE